MPAAQAGKPALAGGTGFAVLVPESPLAGRGLGAQAAPDRLDGDVLQLERAHQVGHHRLAVLRCDSARMSTSVTASFGKAT